MVFTNLFCILNLDLTYNTENLEKILKILQYIFLCNIYKENNSISISGEENKYLH